MFDSSPVFLGGENRSGTTLLSVVLDSHPHLRVGPEIDFLEPRDLGTAVLEAIDLMFAGDARVLGIGTDTGDPFWYHEAHFVKQSERFGVSPDVLRDLIRTLMREHGSDLSSFEDRCRVLDAIGENRLAVSGKRRWGLKLQKKIVRVAEFASHWPSAHFVHIVRDGRDVASSHLHTVAWGAKSVTTAAHSWREIAGTPSRVAPPDRYLEIRYEDLVSDPSRTLHRVCEFLDVPWSPQVLEHWKQPHSLFDTPWAHPAVEAVAQPITPDRVGRFRYDLSLEDIALFESIAQAELNLHGYTLVTEVGGPSRL